ncbi:hypothetical protein KC316_g12668 [Hortaea werneckii]|nr:hypothetical protein KC324_g12587 [Hortaea werneckii]KAI7563896.1 hypothetical protein KC316_g12668 [Hortaea werneckii]
MECSAASVVRGEFVYRDKLFVDVGRDGKRYPRASPSELKDLLNSKVAKDQVGHWYEAQLVHYGSQRSKQKDTAKFRLQPALSQGNAPAKTAKRRKDDQESEKSSKRTKIAMKVGDISINIEHGVTVPEAKKSSSKSSTKATAGTANAKQTADPQGSESATPDATLKTVKGTKKSSASWRDERAPEFGGDSKPNSKAAATSKASAEPKAKAEPRVKSEPKIKPESNIKSEPKIKKEPGTKKPAVIKMDPENDEMQIDSFAQEMPGTRNVTGVYSLSCPQLAEQIGLDEASNFRLFLSVDNGALWGGFELGWKSGVLRADEVAVDRYVSFGWRARDNDRGGSLTFGRGCFGEIVLHGQNEVRGTFTGLFVEPVAFEGRRRPGPLWCGRSPYSFQQEWDGFVKKAYGRG